MTRIVRSLTLVCGGGLLMLLTGACTKEFTCQLGPDQGLCASVSQVYSGEATLAKTKDKDKACDPFSGEDCSGATENGSIPSLKYGKRNQFPLIQHCNPYTEGCLANQPSRPVATAAAPVLPPPIQTHVIPQAQQVMPPSAGMRPLFSPLPQPGSAPLAPQIGGQTAQVGPSVPQGTVRVGEAPFQAPVRIGERILRMWVPDWQDGEGDLHAASFHYVQVAPSAWWPVETPPKQMLQTEKNGYPTPPRRLSNDQRQVLQTGSQTVVQGGTSGVPQGFSGLSGLPSGVPSPFPSGSTPYITPPNQGGANPFGTR